MKATDLQLSWLSRNAVVYVALELVDEADLFPSKSPLTGADIYKTVRSCAWIK
jgi:hypothetical protein